jgi:hypothetical protein
MVSRDELAALVAGRLVERDELQRLMLEPPGGENHGYQVNGSRKSLNWQDWIKEDFLSTPGWGIERPRSDRPPGRPKTVDPKLLTPKAIAAVERRVGVGVDEFQRVTRRGRLPAADRELRDEIAGKFVGVVEKGAVVTGLADVYGCDERTIWRLVTVTAGKVNVAVSRLRVRTAGSR